MSAAPASYTTSVAEQRAAARRRIREAIEELETLDELEHAGLLPPFEGPKTPAEAVDAIAAVFGGQRGLARFCGVVPQAVSNWKIVGVPAAQKWVIDRYVRRVIAALDVGEPAAVPSCA